MKVKKSFNKKVIIIFMALITISSALSVFSVAHATTPSGFTSYNVNVMYANYTLPNYKLNYSSDNTGSDAVITKYSPTHTLTAYYFGVGDYLDRYVFKNGTYTQLAFMGNPDTKDNIVLYPNQLANGSIAGIGFITYISTETTYWIASYYNLYNNTEIYKETNIPVGSQNQMSIAYTGIGNSLTLYFSNATSSEIWNTWYNIYQNKYYYINTSIPDWNSVGYSPLANFYFMQNNVVANSTSEWWIYKYNSTIDNYQLTYSYSNVITQINAVDQNNMPFEQTTFANGTIGIWGYQSIHNAQENYFNIVYYKNGKVLNNVATYSGAVGTTDGNTYVFFDNNGYFLQGQNDYYSQTYQNAYLSPLNNTVLITNSTWFNTNTSTVKIGFNQNMENAVDYFGMSGWENSIEYKGVGKVFIYWIPNKVNEFSPSVNINPISHYNIKINESGLPSGTSWSFVFNGTTTNLNTDQYNLSEKNGTYSFSVPSINGYTVSYPSSITVSGSSQTINVVFHKIATYKVELLESGLPSGTQWNYTFNSNKQVLGNNSYNYSLSNSSYSIYVGSVSGYSLHYANPVVVNGHNVIEYINYSLIPTYSVIIKESGLATNTKWYALINDIQYSSTTAYINLSGLTNSTYTLAINNIAGYLLNSYPSSFIINGKNAYINITFTSDNKLSSISVIAKDVKDISSITWSVVFNGTTYNSQNSNTIVIPSLQNGTYSFKVNSISGYKINSYPSSITIAGKNITENITFNQTFVLYVKESGYNQEWFINLNGTQYSSTNSYINVSGLVNYTYSFSVPQVVGYTASSYPHSVVINGNNYYINITFTFQVFPNGKYEIVFVMTGLPKNTNWTVVINGIQHFSNGSKYINITLTNGTYYPDFLLPNNYQLTNSPPTLIVNGQAEYYSVYANYSFNWYNYTPEFAIVLLFIGVLLIPAVIKRRG